MKSMNVAGALSSLILFQPFSRGIRIDFLNNWNYKFQKGRRWSRIRILEMLRCGVSEKRLGTFVSSKLKWSRESNLCLR